MARIKDAYERQHATNLRLMQKKIDAIYSKFTEEVAAQSQGLGVIDPDQPFRLADYPKIQRSINRLVVSLADSLNAALVGGIKASWELAEQKNDSLCKTLFGTLFDSLTPEKKRSYLQHNDDAIAAFIARKSGGLNLSQNVWNIASLASGMIESTLELGIKSGQDARSIARDLKQYLKFPDKLFRRVRDNEGNLHLSKNAAMFHPGQGVYRSSYKNALRLAATETNIAYRDADHLRHQQLDFVVGIEIHLSNNHTCLNSKGVPEPFFDICDELKGKYPKDFHFNGWHPNCRCYVTTILKTKEEVLRDLDGVDRGSVNAVKDMPKEYEEWLERNADRIRGAEERGTLPYFLKNNEWTWKDGAERPLAGLPAKSEPAKPTALEIAEKRHAARTPEMVAEIKDRLLSRQMTIVAENPTNGNPILGDPIKGGKLAQRGTALDFGNNANYLTSAEIIDKIGGGDLTKGSCSSLALAYIANRGGMDVRDFRDGFSREYFSMNYHISKFTAQCGGSIETEYNDFRSAANLLFKVEKGKEYYFAAGEHAAIIRAKAGSAKFSGYEYLELQSPNSNGWKDLDDNALRYRFSCKRSHSVSGIKYFLTAELVEAEKLLNNKEFREMMTYINTKESEQRKGKFGNIR